MTIFNILISLRRNLTPCVLFCLSLMSPQNQQGSVIVASSSGPGDATEGMLSYRDSGSVPLGPNSSQVYYDLNTQQTTK